MNLVTQAEADLSFTLEDKTSGFGVKIVLIALDGTRYGDNDELIGKTTDIGFRIDPQTGSLFVGRTAEVDLRLSRVLSVVGEIPSRGWKVEMTSGEQSWTFTLREGTADDRKIGIFKMILNLVEVA